MYFSTFLFVQATITLIIKLYKTNSIKYNPKNNITLFSSIAHGFFNILTAQMVNDTQNNKTKNTLLKSKSLDHFSYTSTNQLFVNHLHFLLLNNILLFLIIPPQTHIRMTT